MDNQKLMLSVCPLPHIKFNFEISVPKSTLKPPLRLIQLKLGKLEFLTVTTHKHDNDVTETKCWWCPRFFKNVRLTWLKFQG